MRNESGIQYQSISSDRHLHELWMATVTALPTNQLLRLNAKHVALAAMAAGVSCDVLTTVLPAISEDIITAICGLEADCLDSDFESAHIQAIRGVFELLVQV